MLTFLSQAKEIHSRNIQKTTCNIKNTIINNNDIVTAATFYKGFDVKLQVLINDNKGRFLFELNNSLALLTKQKILL